MIQKIPLLATLLLTVMCAQSAFDPLKVAAEVVLPEDLNSYANLCLKQAIKCISKSHLQHLWLSKKSKTIWITPIAKEMGVFRTTFITNQYTLHKLARQGNLNQLDGILKLMKR